MELKYKKSTDTEHKVKLESRLVSANWLSGSAIGGETATVEVRTSLVGYGAPIEIQGKTESGKKLEKIKGTVRGNKFVGELPIPDDIEADEMVYFEVKLSKNGLDGKSNRIPAVPAVKVSELKWSASEARRGDTLTLSANVKGLRDGTEVSLAIYEYDRDGSHDPVVELPAVVQDEKVELQWEYEYFEDTDEVPSEEELQRYDRHYNPPEYFFVVKVDRTEFGSEQESGLLLFKDYIELTLVDEEGIAVPKAKYHLILADGSEREGELDEDGCAREDDVPPGPYSVFYSEAAE